ncbi:MAG: biopolymer transporter ExbD, partial [candidate division Zixibacteria bacterium]|nr:biopolymer transporter ExbD [candidate division Zixibacteria bacterium]
MNPAKLYYAYPYLKITPDTRATGDRAVRRPFGGSRDDEHDEQINLTPMLDVVFIMLIFFIVTATFV